MSKKLGKKKLIHIADRVLNKPLYIEKNYALNALNFFGGRAGFDFIVTQDEKIPIRQNLFDDEDGGERNKFQILENGTAILPISGTLTHDGTGSNMMSSLGRGYNSIINMADSIVKDSSAKRVAMMLGSNGGEVAGCSTCAETLRKIFNDANMPVWAFVDENAYSAGYWQAVVADKIVLPSSGGVGSVGTVLTHASYENQIKDSGVEITLIHAGDKKVIGNPYKNLSDKDFDELNKEIQYYGSLFRQGVHALRPKLSLSRLEDAQAGTFPGQVAVAEGFADEVMNKDEFFEAFAEVERESTTTISIGTDEMDKEELAALKAKAEKADRLTEQLEEEKKKSASAEKDAQRFKDVLASEEAKGKREKALEILNDKDFSALSADKVKTLLKGMASDEPEKEEDLEKEEPEKEEPEKEEKEEKEENKKEEELHPDAKALLRQAKKYGATQGIESIGEVKDVKTKNNKKDEKVEDKYSSEVEDDPDARLDSFLHSASIVKTNLARSTI